MKTDWSSLWKKEDWWAVWIGFALLLLGVARWLPPVPSINKWTSAAASFPAGAGTLGVIALLVGLTLVTTLIAMAFVGRKPGQYILGFLVVSGLAFVATWIGKNAAVSQWGLEAVLWALFIGLAIGNLTRVPEWLKTGAQTEFFIKTGLVLFGAEILFSTIVKGGLVGMGQALIVILAVWFFAYWIARRMGMEETFSSVMATGVSICGVSAAIAAGGAVKGNPRQTSYVISLVLLLAMPMLVGMPLLARALGLPIPVAAAWMGSTIDTTGAVVAAGTLVDPNVGLQVASLVKLSQNILIGFAAFFLAIWTTLSLKRDATAEKPKPIEIWYRLPKFIIGFVVASIIFSLLVEPSLGAKATSSVLGVTVGYRSWFFALAFVSIGLDTRFKELLAVGKGKPALAFVTAQAFNVLWALLIVWLLWSGVLFPPAIG